MKEIIGKSKIVSNTLPRKVTVNDKDICDNTEIAEKFNNFFVNVGPNLASKISPPSRSFESYFENLNNSIETTILSEEELIKSFKSLKRNKAAGIDDISSNVVLQIADELKTPLLHIFNSSINTGNVPEKLKIAKVTPIFKSGQSSVLSNYRPISVLPVFSKLLERIIYNRIYGYFKDNSLLYEKQFGFQNNNSTEHAILSLVDNISDSFDKGNFTLGVFIDLSKAFDTVNHKILLKKLEKYGIKGIVLKWFESYLSGRQQCVNINQTKRSSYLNITCGVPQGSILGPLLFLIYVNDLPIASPALSTIMFADDTNLFYSSSNIENLFHKVNRELIKISDWFKANKLSLNAKKTKYTLFHSCQQKKFLPNNLPFLSIENNEIIQENVTKFLGVLIDENLSWKTHINSVNSKISKNIGLLYKARPFVKTDCMKQLYFSFVHGYLTYANIAWASTHKTKLKPLYRRQKHAARVIFNKDRFTHAQPLLQEMKALNIFQLNIFQNILFMFKYRLTLLPSFFSNDFFQINENIYGTRAHGKYSLPLRKTKRTQFSICYRGPYLFNEIVYKQNSLQTIENINLLKGKLKDHILDIEETENFF